MSGALNLAGIPSAAATAADVEPLIAPPRTTWQVAGGAAPTIGALDGGSGAVAAGIGTGATQASSFNQIGAECFAHARIIFGTGATGVTGYWTLEGLPVAPFNQARFIGHGMLIDSSDDYRVIPVQVVLDPTFSTTKPVIFIDYGLTAGVVKQVFFSGEGTIPPICVNGSPFAIAESDILNVTMQFEAAA